MLFICPSGCSVDIGMTRSKQLHRCDVHGEVLSYGKPLSRPTDPNEQSSSTAQKRATRQYPKASAGSGTKKGKGLKRTARRESAPKWLREGFRDGVDEREQQRTLACCLFLHDPAARPCSGRLERLHWIGRQRVRNALWCSLPLPCGPDLILLAEWDPRNGGIACEGHHRRFDRHLTPELVVPRSALPAHVEEFIADWGLELQATDKFPERDREFANG
jgi:hypothetical protein